MSRWRWLFAIGVSLACGVFFVILWPLHNPHPHPRTGRGDLAIENVKIYVAPDVPAINRGTVLMQDGMISAVEATVDVPKTARALSCDHCVLTAGFWNTHIHFTEPKWSWAAWKTSEVLNRQLVDMLTSRGFTTVVDAGSNLMTTISLRRRIETGKLLGPAIYTAGSPLYPPRGVPFYLKASTPAYIQWLMLQPGNPVEAVNMVERNIATGADFTKLFTGSYVERGKVLPMPEDIAAAAVQTAHQHQQIVYSHPSDLAGTQVAIESGVDVLAHAPDTVEGIDRSLLETIVDRHMAMVPTLKMFATTVTKNPAYLQPIYSEVRQFHALGGQLLFGTDVGYMTDYTTEDEFRALQQCGLSMPDVLKMLTVAPAQRFGVSHEKGTVTPGKLADVVVLDADPAQDLTAFAKVHWTIRSGRILYER